MTIRVTEAELARDVLAALENVARGKEVIIEREDHRPVAVMKQPQPVGRKIGECIALARPTKRNSVMHRYPMKILHGMCGKASMSTGNPFATFGTNSAWD